MLWSICQDMKIWSNGLLVVVQSIDGRIGKWSSRLALMNIAKIPTVYQGLSCVTNSTMKYRRVCILQITENITIISTWKHQIEQLWSIGLGAGGGQNKQQ